MVYSTGTNRVMTSPDGITWTARQSAADTNGWQVGWSPDLFKFVAVAVDGKNREIPSSNGVTNTARP